MDVAASVIAVVQISGKITSILKTYIEGVRDAKEDIRKLYTSVQGLRAIVARFPPSKDGNTSVTLASMLEEIQNLEKTLNRNMPVADSRTRDIAKRLIWPFHISGVGKMVDAIEKGKATLILEFGVEVRKEIRLAKATDERQEIIRWLSRDVPDPSTEHNIARSKHEATTGNWLINCTEFATWKSTDNSYLWLNGGGGFTEVPCHVAGAGKSILCSTVIDHIQNSCLDEPGVAYCYWYFTFADKEKQSLRNMLCSIVRDIFSNRRDTPHKYQTIYRQSNHGNQRPTQSQLLELLKASIDGFKDIYIVVDALDECPQSSGERKCLLDSFNSIFSWEFAQLHVLTTSRKEHDIVKCYDITCSSKTSAQQLSALGYRSSRDISLYIQNRLNDDSYDWWPTPLKAEVKETLIEQANGMFRLVALQLETLQACGNEKGVRSCLEVMPTDLDNFYCQMLSKVHVKHRTHVSRALQWIAFLPFDISVEQLTEAIVVNADAAPYFDVDDRLEPGYILKILPAGLCTIFSTFDPTSHWLKNSTQTGNHQSTQLKSPLYGVSKTGQSMHPSVTIRIAHYSVLEYLSSQRIQNSCSSIFQLNEELSEAAIAETCFAYVISMGKKSVDDNETTVLDLVYVEFYIHVCMYILRSLKSTSWTQGLKNLCMLVFDEKSPVWHFWDTQACKSLASMFSPTISHCRGIYETPHGSLHPNPFTWACSNGYEHIVRTLVPRVSNLNECHLLDISVGPPLFAAISSGSLAVVSTLLESGASVSCRWKGMTPLHWAARELHYHYNDMQQIGRLLIAKGADIDALTAEEGRTPLNIAVCQRQNTLSYHREFIPNYLVYRVRNFVNLLLRSNASIALPTEGFNSGDYLVEAARYGCSNLIERLLDDGADVNYVSRHGSALETATCLTNSSECVRLLLRRGADGWCASTEEVIFSIIRVTRMSWESGPWTAYSTERDKDFLHYSIDGESKC